MSAYLKGPATAPPVPYAGKDVGKECKEAARHVHALSQSTFHRIPCGPTRVRECTKEGGVLEG